MSLLGRTAGPDNSFLAVASGTVTRAQHFSDRELCLRVAADGKRHEIVERGEIRALIICLAGASIGGSLFFVVGARRRYRGKHEKEQQHQAHD